MSAVRQNFHAECENGINQQINNELASSYFYQSVAFHFDRDDVALANFHKYFCKLSEKKKENAERLMKYMNERGGRIKFADISMPANNFGEPFDLMEQILNHEKKVYLQVHVGLVTAICLPFLLDFLSPFFMLGHPVGVRELSVNHGLWEGNEN